MASQAILIESASATKYPKQALIRMRSGPSRRHVILVHPIGGGILCYQELAGALAHEATIHGAQHPGVDGGDITDRTVEDLARRYVDQLDDAGLTGDIYLLGWSMGGLIAYEMAHQLRAHPTKDVSRIFMIDSWVAGDPLIGSRTADGGRVARDFLHDIVGGAELPSGVEDLDHSDSAAVLRDGSALLRAAGLIRPTMSRSDTARLFRVYDRNHEALRRYRPPAPPGPVDLVVARRLTMQRRGLVPAGQVLDRTGPSVREFEVDADHFSIVTGAATAEVASISRAIRRLRHGGPIRVTARGESLWRDVKDTHRAGSTMRST